MSKFDYSKKEINDIITQSNLKPVVMEGVFNDLKELKPAIEELYDNKIFYLSYFATDAPYFGWIGKEAQEKIEEMLKITDAISQKFIEIYALILAGLGEVMEDESTKTNN